MLILGLEVGLFVVQEKQKRTEIHQKNRVKMNPL